MESHMILFAFLFTLAPRGAAGIAPLVVAGIGAGVKAFSSWLKNKGKKKQAKEQLAAQQKTHKVSEGVRTNKNAAAQALLGSLFGGRYAVDPTSFAGLQTERPFTGADPTKGMDYGLAGDLAGAVGDAGLNYGLANYPAAPPQVAAPPEMIPLGGANPSLSQAPSFPGAPVEDPWQD